MNSNSNKAKLRRTMKARRKELAADEKVAADATICEKLKARRDIGEMVDPFDFGSPLAVYLASPDEINIDPYIEYMLHMGVKVVAPRWNGETYELAKLKGLDEKNLRRGPRAGRCRYRRAEESRRLDHPRPCLYARRQAPWLWWRMVRPLSRICAEGRRQDWRRLFVPDRR